VGGSVIKTIRLTTRNSNWYGPALLVEIETGEIEAIDRIKRRSKCGLYVLYSKEQGNRTRY
jgi:hypothetical protein